MQMALSDPATRCKYERRRVRWCVCVCVDVAQMDVPAPVCTADGLLFLAKDFKKGPGLDEQDLIEEGKPENER